MFILPALAQKLSGENKGEVVDPGNSAVVNATVTLISRGTGLALKATTNTGGMFVFPSVAAGAYDLDVQSAGFRTYVRSGIALTSSEIRDLGAWHLAPAL